MALGIENIAGSIASTVSILDITISTSGTNRIVVLAIQCGSYDSVATVSGIASTGLTWASRSRQTLPAGSPSYGQVTEVWWALAASQLTNLATEITFSGTIDDGVWTCFAVSGVYDTSNPWDSNASLPKKIGYSGAGSPSQGVISTSAPDTLIFAVVGATTDETWPDANKTPVSMNTLQALNNNGGVQYEHGNGEYLIYSAVQTNLTVGWSGNHPVFALIIDALAGSGGGETITIDKWFTDTELPVFEKNQIVGY